ncbi:sigma factor, partial [Pseudopedobacter sp.]|uniref:RNA polymerase sigma factor n=1 Tax=Pseudopedobacter sp. TaxID=1936787 RepID=UPI0033422897
MSHTGIQLWPDDELLELMRQGDRSAFERIYNKYWSKIYISAYNLLRDRQTCEDLVQEVLVNLWVRRESLEVKNLNAFLYTAIRYKVFKVIRSGKVREDLYDEIENLTIADNNTENSIAENDFNRFLEESLATL